MYRILCRPKNGYYAQSTSMELVSWLTNLFNEFLPPSGMAPFILMTTGLKSSTVDDKNGLPSLQRLPKLDLAVWEHDFSAVCLMLILQTFHHLPFLAKLTPKMGCKTLINVHKQFVYCPPFTAIFAWRFNLALVPKPFLST